MNLNISVPNHNLTNSTRRMICNHDCLTVGSMALSYSERITCCTPQQEENRTAVLITTRQKMKQMMRSLSENEEIHNSHTSANIAKTPNENTPSVLRMSIMMGSSGRSRTSPNSSVVFNNESNGEELSPLNFVSPEYSDDDGISSSTMDFIRSLNSHQEEQQDLMEIIDDISSLDEAISIPARRILG